MRLIERARPARQARLHPGRLQRAAEGRRGQPTRRGSRPRCRRSATPSSTGRGSSSPPISAARRARPNPALSLAPVRAALAERSSGKPVQLAPDCVGPEVEGLVDALRAGRRAAAREPALPRRGGEERRAVLARPGATGRRLHQRRLRHRPPRPRLDGRHGAASSPSAPPASCCSASASTSARCCARRSGRWWRSSAAPRCRTRSR